MMHDETAIRRTTPGFGDLSGAFADFGTFLPLVVGILAVGRFDATGVLVGFGLFALAVAVVYRRPIPAQPMKAVAALIIVGAVTPAEAMASGLIIGAVLTGLALAGVIGRLARAVPASVLLGVQLGVGAQLAILGIRHAADQPWYGAAGLAILGAFYFTRFKNLSCLLVVASSAGLAVVLAPGGLQDIAVGINLPGVGWPTAHDFEAALLTTALPQLALTLSNAILATAAIAGEFFPGEEARMSPARLAASTGIFNLVLAPFGALPMCHGSGGLVAQYGFGARTWLAPVIFGVFCLTLGVGFGPDAKVILGLIPIGAVGALLAVAGAELALSRRIFKIKASCRIVVVLTGIACIATNMAAGLVIGLVLEGIRTAYVRRQGESSTAS